jgi:uncharacterized membrane protein YbhN (UPF0104 family)
VHRVARFGVGVAVGGGALLAYLAAVGVDGVVGRAAGIAPWAVAVAALLVVAEGVADSVGVWASVRPLGRGIGPGRSVQFAMAGDFFDTVSPAGPVSSEPIMARFVGVETGTTYSEALAVRTVAKYVKSGTQSVLSALLALALLLGDPSSPRAVLLTLGGAVAVLLVVGAVAVRFRTAVSRGLVVLAAPVVRRLSALYREEPYGRAAIRGAVDRFWERIVRFRDRPGLLALIAFGGVLEQLLVAAALWAALAGAGAPVALLPIVAVVPLPQAASVVPIPGSLGAYDVLLSGALVLMTGAPAVATAAAALLIRSIGVPFGLAVGGLSAAFLRGWRPA